MAKFFFYNPVKGFVKSVGSDGVATFTKRRSEALIHDGPMGADIIQMFKKNRAMWAPVSEIDSVPVMGAQNARSCNSRNPIVVKAMNAKFKAGQKCFGMSGGKPFVIGDEPEVVTIKKVLGEDGSGEVRYWCDSSFGGSSQNYEQNLVACDSPEGRKIRQMYPEPTEVRVQFVGGRMNGKMMSLADAKRSVRVTGVTTAPRSLGGFQAPSFEGYVGPMHGGTKTLRYESHDAYAMLSV